MAAVRRHKAEQFAATHYTRMWSAAAAYVRRKLTRTAWHLPEPELEVAYNHAWCALIQTLIADKQPDNVQGWLNVVTYRRALAYLRRGYVTSEVSLSEADVMPMTSASVCDIASDREQLRALFAAIRHRCDRDARILAYLWIAQLPRRAIAVRMGLPLKRLDYILDGAQVRGGLRAEATRLLEMIATGNWCEAQKSLLAAHTLGWFAPGSPKDKAARAHLQACPACRAGTQ